MYSPDEQDILNQLNHKLKNVYNLSVKDLSDDEKKMLNRINYENLFKYNNNVNHNNVIMREYTHLNGANAPTGPTYTYHGMGVINHWN
jgi:hypothetical protein